MSPSRAVAPLILALAVLGACSSPAPAAAPPTQQPAPAEPATPTAGLCEQLDAGVAPLQACVEQTGQTEAQCREQAASGGAS